MKQEELHNLKSAVADAFATLHFADVLCLTEKEVKNISRCLMELNEYLNRENTSDADQDCERKMPLQDYVCIHASQLASDLTLLCGECDNNSSKVTELCDTVLKFSICDGVPYVETVKQR